MLCFILQMILQCCLNSNWLHSSFHSWVQQCQNANSAESVEMLREVHDQLWLLIGFTHSSKLDGGASGLSFWYRKTLIFIQFSGQLMISYHLDSTCKFYEPMCSEQVRFPCIR